MIDDGLMFRVFQQAAKLNALCLIHAENGSAIDVIVSQALAAGHTAPRCHALTRSAEAEAEATHRAIALADMAGATVYIVHLSNDRCLARTQVRAGPRSPSAGRNLHAIPRPLARRTDAGTTASKWQSTSSLRLCAKRRTRRRYGRHWPMARSPSSPPTTAPSASPTRSPSARTTSRRFRTAAPASRIACSLLWHYGVNAGLITPERFVALTSAEPARIFGMESKGAIAPGKDADILLWDPNADYTISAATQAMNTDYSMFEGWQVKGNVAQGLLARRADRRPRQVPRRSPAADASCTAKPTPESSFDLLRRGAGNARYDTARLYNADLAPTAPARRTWTTYNYIALWFSMSMEVTTYMLASSLIAGGMNWKQAVGHHPARQPHRAHPHAAERARRREVRHPVPGLRARQLRHARARTSPRCCAPSWPADGSASSPGSAASPSPPWSTCSGPRPLRMPSVLWICFLGFWLLNMFVVWRGVESIRFLQSFSAPFLLVMSLALLAFMTHKAGGFGPMLAAPSKFATTGAFLALLLPYAHRHGRLLGDALAQHPRLHALRQESQESQIVGQAFGLPVAMTLYSFIGIACTSASTVVFGEPIWSPITLLGRFHQPLIAFLALISILIATLNVNIGANVVGPSNDFSNLAPQLISFRTGGLITGFLGLAMMPWKLMASLRQLHLRLAGRLLRPARPGRRHHGRGLLPPPPHATSKYPTSTAATASTTTATASTPRPSSRWSSASSSPSSASSFPPCISSTTTPGLSASFLRVGFT